MMPSIKESVPIINSIKLTIVPNPANGTPLMNQIIAKGKIAKKEIPDKVRPITDIKRKGL